jgi:hypothetical protein
MATSRRVPITITLHALIGVLLAGCAPAPRQPPAESSRSGVQAKVQKYVTLAHAIAPEAWDSFSRSQELQSSERLSLTRMATGYQMSVQLAPPPREPPPQLGIDDSVKAPPPRMPAPTAPAPREPPPVPSAPPPRQPPLPK